MGETGGGGDGERSKLGPLEDQYLDRDIPNGMGSLVVVAMQRSFARAGCLQPPVPNKPYGFCGR